MYRTDLILSDRDFDALSLFIEAFPELAEDAAKATFQRSEAALLAQLRYKPGAVRYPIQWTSERQRKAFFASNGFGRGIGAPRTDTMIRAWRAGVLVNSAGILLNVGNSTPYARYVVGDTRRGQSARSPQQGFHRNTGWLPVADTLDYWAGVLNTDFRREWAHTLDAKAP